MKRKSLIALPLFATLAACVQSTPVVDSHFGQAFNLLKAQQVINPEGGRDPDPVAGIDAKAAKSGYDQYQRSYQAQEKQPNVFTIGISGGR